MKCDLNHLVSVESSLYLSTIISEVDELTVYLQNILAGISACFHPKNPRIFLRAVQNRGFMSVIPKHR